MMFCYTRFPAGSFISENCSIVSSGTTGEPDVAVVAAICMFGCSWWKPFAVVMFLGKENEPIVVIVIVVVVVVRCWMKRVCVGSGFLYNN